MTTSEAAWRSIKSPAELPADVSAHGRRSDRGRQVPQDQKDQGPHVSSGQGEQQPSEAAGISSSA